MSSRVLSDSDLDAGSASDGAGHKSKDPSPEPTRRSSGDSDSSVGGGASRPKRAAGPSAPVMDSDDDGDSGSDWDSRFKTKKLKKKKPPPATQARRTESGAEDGELSSAGEEESEASLDSEAEYDGLFADLEDRRRVEAMTEKEREVEIYKRMEKRDIAKRRREIEKKLNRKAKAGQRSSDSPPSAKRPRTTADREKERKKESLQHLKEQRRKKEAAKEAAQKKEVLNVDKVFGSDSDSEDEAPRRPARRRSRSSSSSSSSSSAGGSRPRRRSRSSSGSSSDSEEDLSAVQKKRAIGTLEELEQARISRFRLAELVHRQNFERVASGCFVRVGIGRNQAGKETYRICQIVGVVQTGKVYEVEKTTTNKGLKLRFGGDERVFRLAFVSNAKFEESEFGKWKEAMEKAKHPLPSVEHCERKEKEVKDAFKHRLTEADIDHIVKEKKKFTKNPAKFAVTKTNLIKEREAALEEGNQELADQISWKIQALEEQSAELYRKQDEGIRGVSWINRKNKEKMKETFLTPKTAEQAQAYALLEEEDKDNPFNRKNSRTRMVVGPQRAVKASAPQSYPQGVKNAMAAARALGNDPTPSTSAASTDSGGGPAYLPPVGSTPLLSAAAPKPRMPPPKLPPPPPKETPLLVPVAPVRPPSLYDAHAFDIDIQIPDVPGLAVGSSGGGAVAATPKPLQRKTLSLDAYKQKRNLI